MNDDSAPSAPIGVIGGSGFYSLFDDAASVTVDTPYGAPSDAVTVGTLGDRSVAFLPRHGRGHDLPPHGVNYRANLWALKTLGVGSVVGVNAVGSLSPEVPAGSLVVPDQLVDRTWGRESTYFDGPEVAHASMADPYCADGRARALEAAAAWPAVDGGTQVVIQGPRFNTRAESRWYAAGGGTIVGMTACPEVGLARELGLCYTPLCLVTDMDAGFETGEGVTQEEVFAAFKANVDKLRAVVARLVARLPIPRACDCASLAPAAV
ncbi:MAG TPA: S-methyl-5'-thioadenosine phosphorylase [Stackebrandtia sp.]|jgi:5'-methylthioadenosine phosphorylase|uniref:S-methyl-5'-thioadenosine phosphorylase n=1 Tax=Stackebrandtia sp. TaxID=2023065 RepID=UPI002D510C78|nr:S-methyl-5'-thioadenosine phosphorylase [Stackebrandtia sp.]HZE41929.1 S-methyl-5'-thioadenosine phosphorylase [Stackebrandtia sp.]